MGLNDEEEETQEVGDRPSHLLVLIGFLVASSGFPEAKKLLLLSKKFFDDDELIRATLNYKQSGLNRLQFYLCLKINGGLSPNIFSLCERLLKTGICEVNGQNPFCKSTTLHYAIQNGAPSDIVRLILAAPGIDCNIKNAMHESPLLKSARMFNYDTIEALMEPTWPLKIPIEVNSCDHLGRTPLFWAAGTGQNDVVRMLLQHPSINVNFKTKASETPLSWAVSSGHKDVVGQLLQHPDIDPNIRIGSHGFTPLMIAVSNDRCDIAQLILHHKNIDVHMHPSAPEYSDWTAITFSGSAEMSNLLETYGL
jgi:ankyrin repeat protein